VGIVKVSPCLKVIFERGIQEKEYHKLRQHERRCKPLVSESFIDKLDVLLGIQLRKKKTGQKGPWKNRGNK